MKKINLNCKKGITLISLIITIIILIILAGIVIYSGLNNNGILNHASKANEVTNKETATEKINLKITTVQMNKYAEKQEMPTLKELSEFLKDDNEIAYVTEKSQIASKKYEVGENPSSIFTKLKEYPYEFEINSSLQLASINGVKIVANNVDSDISNDYSLNEVKTNETWMGKPIYRKTIYVEKCPNGTTLKCKHNVENVERIWINTGKSFAIWSDQETIIPLPMIHTTNIAYQMEVTVNYENLMVYSAVNRENIKAYITIEYTKK